MSSTDATEPKVEETKPAETTDDKKPLASSSVFSMFGGGAKKEKKEEEDRGDVSGSAKAQREAEQAAKAAKAADGEDDEENLNEEANAEFEPVHDLRNAVPQEQKKDDILYTINGKLYLQVGSEWKERAKPGVVNLLRDPGSGKVQLTVRDVSKKLRANHFLGPELGIKPNAGSDKAFAWTAPNDESEDVDGKTVKTRTFGLVLKNPEVAQEFLAEYEKHSKANDEINKANAAKEASA